MVCIHADVFQYLIPSPPISFIADSKRSKKIAIFGQLALPRDSLQCLVDTCSSADSTIVGIVSESLRSIPIRLLLNRFRLFALTMTWVGYDRSISANAVKIKARL